MDNEKLDHITTIVFGRQMTEVVRVEDTFSVRQWERRSDDAVVVGFSAEVGNYYDVFVDPLRDSRLVSSELVHECDQLRRRPRSLVRKQLVLG